MSLTIAIRLPGAAVAMGGLPPTGTVAVAAACRRNSACRAMEATLDDVAAIAISKSRHCSTNTCGRGTVCGQYCRDVPCTGDWTGFAILVTNPSVFVCTRCYYDVSR